MSATVREYKAPPRWRPGPHSSSNNTGVVAVDPARATVTMVAAVSGTVDEVGDRIVPGAFTRTLRSRTTKVCLGHKWDTPIGRIVSIKEPLARRPASTRGHRLRPTLGAGLPRR